MEKTWPLTSRNVERKGWTVDGTSEKRGTGLFWGEHSNWIAWGFEAPGETGD